MLFAEYHDSWVHYLVSILTSCSGLADRLKIETGSCLQRYLELQSHHDSKFQALLFMKSGVNNSFMLAKVKIFSNMSYYYASAHTAFETQQNCIDRFKTMAI